MKMVTPLWLSEFHRRVSCVRPKTRKLQGPSHWWRTEVMALSSLYDICPVVVVVEEFEAT